MKKFWILIISIFVISLLLISYFVIYPLWGRRLIYKSGSKITSYSGNGQITEPFIQKLFVIPKGEGRPSFEPLENKNIFDFELYDVFTIPTQDQLLYTVGNFEKWEDIDGSLDKYLVLKNNEKYRVGNSDLFGDNATNFAIEEVSISNKKENKVVNTKVIPNFKKGDTVILTPVFDPPELAKMDEWGNLLTSWVVVRRVGGKI